jgi:hypothetical protein
MTRAASGIFLPPFTAGFFLQRKLKLAGLEEVS